MDSPKCSCVSCSECRGSGLVRYETNSYPEWDLTTCRECDGSGVIEECDNCAYRDQLEDWC